MRKLFGLLALLSLATPALGAGKTVVATAAGDDQLSTLVAAVKAAGLVDTLNGDGPFTILAPTNAAFDKLGKETLNGLLKPENKQKLAAILKDHVIPGKVMARDAVRLDGKAVETAAGSKVPIRVVGGKATFGGATVTRPDIACSNGVIHVVDAVILPPDG
jgi:uncharacterized surface protein with fasciclin (FAS1) repeats